MNIYMAVKNVVVMVEVGLNRLRLTLMWCKCFAAVCKKFYEHKSTHETHFKFLVHLVNLFTKVEKQDHLFIKVALSDNLSNLLSNFEMLIWPWDQERLV